MLLAALVIAATALAATMGTLAGRVTIGVPEQRRAYVVESEQAPMIEPDHETSL